MEAHYVCWFVAVAVPGKARAALERACAAAGRALHFTEPYEAVSAAFPPGSIGMVVTCGGCSCDFYRPPREPPAAQLAKARSRMERKGWKAARIERALHDMAEAAAHSESPRGRRPDFDRFVSALVHEAGEAVLFAYLLQDNEHEEPAVAPACDGSTTRTIAEFAAGEFPPHVLVTVR
jgi:hypothetical protein